MMAKTLLPPPPLLPRSTFALQTPMKASNKEHKKTVGYQVSPQAPELWSLAREARLPLGEMKDGGAESEGGPEWPRYPHPQLPSAWSLLCPLKKEGAKPSLQGTGRERGRAPSPCGVSDPFWGDHIADHRHLKVSLEG